MARTQFEQNAVELEVLLGYGRRLEVGAEVIKILTEQIQIQRRANEIMKTRYEGELNERRK